VILLAGAVALAACEGANEEVGMGGMEAVDAPLPPAVAGYAEGEEIAFLHTEASDSAVAKLLTDMMGSPVLLVPRLARVADEALAEVFVFQNGIEPEGPRGPFGFQPDVFDCPPGAECYSPLRAVNLVNWSRPEEARPLTSAEEVRRAAEQGQIRIERPGIVVNMPLVQWPGGER
jgi:hypothetical protein